MSQEYEDISREFGHVIISNFGRHATFMAPVPSAKPPSSSVMKYRSRHVGDARKSPRPRQYHELCRLNRVTGCIRSSGRSFRLICIGTLLGSISVIWISEHVRLHD
jgi:hypothetical protein